MIVKSVILFGFWRECGVIYQKHMTIFFRLWIQKSTEKWLHFFARGNGFRLTDWTTIMNSLERISALSCLNGFREYQSVLFGGMTALDISFIDVPLAISKFLPRSAQTLTSLEIRYWIDHVLILCCFQFYPDQTVISLIIIIAHRRRVIVTSLGPQKWVAKVHVPCLNIFLS